MKIRYLFIAAAVCWMFSCTPSSQLESSWNSPELEKDSNRLFKKVLFIALLKDDAARRTAEDRLVEQVKSKAVASYKYWGTAGNVQDKSLLSTRLKQDGFDGIIILRLAADDKQHPYVPGAFPSYYSSWYGYYSTTYPRFSDPGYYGQANLYHIETNVYSLANDKLLWSGITTIVQTADTRKMVDQVIVTVREKMRRQGLIK